MEIMIDRNIDSSCLVDPVHVRQEVGAMAVSSLVLADNKQVGMDHLMQEGFYQVLARSKL